jgi:hypothetical protein
LTKINITLSPIRVPNWAKGLPEPTGPYEIFYGPTTGDGEPPKDFGGHKVKIVVTVDHYHGPGTYSVSTEGRPIAHLELSVDNYQYYTSGTGTGAQAVVKPDASGSVSFGAVNSQTGKLIGTIDWTCKVQ